MRPFTVVLLRPEYILDEPSEYGQDIYVASRIMADDEIRAVKAAQNEAYKADKREGLQPRGRTDYALCVLFTGHHEPALFGWQAH